MKALRRGLARGLIYHPRPPFDDELDQKISWPGELHQKVERQVAFARHAGRKQSRCASARLAGEFDFVGAIGGGSIQVWYVDIDVARFMDESPTEQHLQLEQPSTSPSHPPLQLIGCTINYLAMPII
jgi:hypothetical protein